MHQLYNTFQLLKMHKLYNTSQKLAVVENCSTMQYTADQTNKKPFMFTIWDDLTDNEGVVLLQLLHEHTVILAKRVVVTAYRRGKCQ
ncbi:hypothetical protein KY284_026528 [Solanum tuberosum]|nr:hypothetical protein KY284_026528 [Solanum tuberosum]